MRIAYGVHGYGRGHAMRALAVLPELGTRHELLVLAGGEAFTALEGQFAPLRIPCLTYVYNTRGRLSVRRTARRDLPGVLDMLWRGPGLEMVTAALKDFRPDVVISDSEGYTHQAAARLAIPRISFDHFGLLVYCRPEMPALDRLRCRGQALIYHRLFGTPERVVVSAFFDAPPLRPGVAVVGPVIRDAVRCVSPSRGDYLLAYFSQGDSEFTPQAREALAGAGCPVRVYGTTRQGDEANLEFKPISREGFVQDLAGCRGVLATTGNQLIGEVLHFGKPMLGVPIDCLEQRLNARQIERMGIGMSCTRRQLNTAVVREFLSREDQFRAHLHTAQRDGRADAVAANERFAAEQAVAGRP